MTEVTVSVSQPYIIIGGGWTGLRPQGRRRDYRAEVLGRTFVNTNKSEIQSAIRAFLYRETGSSRARFAFVQEAR